MEPARLDEIGAGGGSVMLRNATGISGYLLLLSAAAVAFGQAPERAVVVGTVDVVGPERTIGDALRSLASRSGVVFVGQVIGLQRKEGFVEVSLRVDQRVVGAVGPIYVLREWAGLWSANQERLAVGQRGLFFFHAVGAAGLSSLVDGTEGIVPLIPMGADQPALLDLRWLDTRLVRAGLVALPSAGVAAIALPDGIRIVANWRLSSVPEPERLALPPGMLPVPQQAVALPVSIVKPIHSPVSRGPADAR